MTVVPKHDENLSDIQTFKSLKISNEGSQRHNLTLHWHMLTFQRSQHSLFTIILMCMSLSQRTTLLKKFYNKYNTRITRCQRGFDRVIRLCNSFIFASFCLAARTAPVISLPCCLPCVLLTQHWYTNFTIIRHCVLILDFIYSTHKIQCLLSEYAFHRVERQ